MEKRWLRESEFNRRLTDHQFTSWITFTSSGSLGTGSGCEWLREIIIPPFRNNFFNRPESNKYCLKPISEKGSQRCEKNFLMVLLNKARASHPHLTRHFAGFYHGEKYYLISELAESNLDRYIKDNPRQPSAYTGEDLLWLVKQMRGLAGAVHTIHKPAKYLTGFHHDLKLANVLVFGSGTEIDLRITDWGEAKVVSSHLTTVTSAAGSSEYRPPEYWIESNKKKIKPQNEKTGTSYDIWSLACVFLEIIIWLRQGNHELANFTAARRTFPKSTTFFYVDDLKNPVALKPQVQHQIDMINGMSTAPGWNRVAKVLRNMFEMDDKVRPTAETVCQELDEALKEGIGS